MLDRLKRTIPALLCAALLAAGPAALAREPELTTMHPPPVQAAIKPDRNTYQIIVDKQAQVVTVMRRGINDKYNVLVRQMRCSTGRKPKYTPEGSFKIYAKSPWLRTVTGEYVQYTSRFKGQILFHSIPYKKANPRTLVGEAYRVLGQPVSAGCVRLVARDCKWIYDNCPTGTRVLVVASGGPAVRAVEPVPELPEGQTWDPTDEAIAENAPPAA